MLNNAQYTAIFIITEHRHDMAAGTIEALLNFKHLQYLPEKPGVGLK